MLPKEHCEQHAPFGPKKSQDKTSSWQHAFFPLRCTYMYVILWHSKYLSHLILPARAKGKLTDTNAGLISSILLWPCVSKESHWMNRLRFDHSSPNLFGSGAVQCRRWAHQGRVPRDLQKCTWKITKSDSPTSQETKSSQQGCFAPSLSNLSPHTQNHQGQSGFSCGVGWYRLQPTSQWILVLVTVRRTPVLQRPRWW